MIEFKFNGRGFLAADFKDRYGVQCSIQKSSLAGEDAIWLGADACRMHLTQELVKELLPALQSFAETGELPPPVVRSEDEPSA